MGSFSRLLLAEAFLLHKLQHTKQVANKSSPYLASSLAKENFSSHPLCVREHEAKSIRALYSRAKCWQSCHLDGKKLRLAKGIVEISKANPIKRSRFSNPAQPSSNLALTRSTYRLTPFIYLDMALSTQQLLCRRTSARGVYVRMAAYTKQRPNMLSSVPTLLILNYHPQPPRNQLVTSSHVFLST